MLLLARIRKQQGRLEEALRLASKALGFRQNVLGNRLKVCDSLYYVADLLHLRGNSATAMYVSPFSILLFVHSLIAVD